MKTLVSNIKSNIKHKTLIKIAILLVFTSVFNNACVSTLANKKIVLSEQDKSAQAKKTISAYTSFIVADLLKRKGELEESSQMLDKALLYDQENPMLYMAKSNILVEQGKFKDAINSSEKALLLDPQFYSAHIQLGSYYGYLPDFSLAEKHLLSAIELKPENPEAYIELVNQYRSQKRFEDGLLIIQKFEEKNKDIFPYLIMMRGFLKKDLKNPSAKDDFIFILEKYPYITQAQQALMSLYYAEGKLDNVSTNLEALILEKPYFKWIYPTLVELYIQKEEYNALDKKFETWKITKEEQNKLRLHAVEILTDKRHYKNAIHLLKPLLSDKKDTQAIYIAALIHLREQQYELSLNFLKLIKQEDQLYPQSIALQARILQETKKTSVAISTLTNYISSNPDNDLINAALIDIYLDSKAFDKALARADRILEQNPQDMTTLSQKAFIITEMGKLDEGIALLEKALERYPQNIKLYESLAELYSSNDRLLDSVNTLKKALVLKQDNLSLRFTLATYYSKLSMHDESLAQMQKVLEYDQDNPDALNFIAYTWSELDLRLEEAESLSKKAIELAPNNAYMLDTLGWIYYKMKKFDLAIDTLTKAIAIGGKEPVIFEHLGDAYIANDNKIRALDCYKKAIDSFKDIKKPDPEEWDRIHKKHDNLSKSIKISPLKK